MKPPPVTLSGTVPTITDIDHEAVAASLEDSTPQEALGWMFDTPTGPGRIKAGVPAGWRVAHKTGTGGYGPTNDIGLLYPPSGEPLVLAVYFHATPESTSAQNDAVIADATRMTLAAIDADAPA